MPCGKPHAGNYLWNRTPFTLTPENVIRRCPRQARDLRHLLRDAVQEVGAPPETLRRLGLR